ncbi:MAG: polysaccharide lyase family 1 protein [Treponema sp.]|nr:polysaccharide lyase family 1 protein [Treponema sp.]
MSIRNVFCRACFALVATGCFFACKTEAEHFTSESLPSLEDIPTGYAGIGFTSFYDKAKVVTVSTKSDLVSYAKQGGYTIFIDGMIDMSEGMLPSTGGGSTSALDAFVAKNSAYSTYSAYNAANVKSVSASANWTNPLNSAYGTLIRIQVASKTAIIGKSSGCGIKGGAFYISGKSNVVLRNLVIQDAYDPFPKHESGDGWNAQQDNVHIEKSTNVWIDHCTIEDTLTLATGANGEKWQTYDGLCDITNLGSADVYVTVSNCIFRNHDKTMLIGSSDSDGAYSSSLADESKVHRFVTLSGNYFQNCGQRLPMVRNTLIHIYNNYYTTSGSPYASQSAVNARSGSIVYAENNYFGSGLKYSFNASKTNATTPVLHASGNSGSTVSATSNISATDSETFLSRSGAEYVYSAISASATESYVPSSAGAGVISFN